MAAGASWKAQGPTGWLRPPVISLACFVPWPIAGHDAGLPGLPAGVPVANPARRANHFVLPESCQPSRWEIFCFTEYSNQDHNPHRPGPLRDVRDRHDTLARDAMDAVASGGLSPDENAAAYGEDVWSWRRNPGVYPRCPVVAWQR